MATQIFNKKELLTSIGEAVSQLHDLMSSLNENEVNTIPYKDSWTPGQLFRHIAKSNSAIAAAMGAEGQPAERDAAENIPELEKIFLDFSGKLKSPDFIVPEKGPYEKEEIIIELDKSFELLKENTKDATLTNVVNDAPIGPASKLEMLHFVLYHTQRHLHQMRKICDALKKR